MVGFKVTKAAWIVKTVFIQQECRSVYRLPTVGS